MFRQVLTDKFSLPFNSRYFVGGIHSSPSSRCLNTTPPNWAWPQPGLRALLGPKRLKISVSIAQRPSSHQFQRHWSSVPFVAGRSAGKMLRQQHGVAPNRNTDNCLHTCIYDHICIHTDMYVYSLYYRCQATKSCRRALGAADLKSQVPKIQSSSIKRTASPKFLDPESDAPSDSCTGFPTLGGLHRRSAIGSVCQGS